MTSVIQDIEAGFKKSAVVEVRPGDTVRVHQRIREGNKERIQIFQGQVIRTSRKGSLMNRFTVRRIASGIGVEKSFLSHSPLVLKVEVTKRSKVRRNYLSYLRERTGKATRMTGIEFDREKVNAIHDTAAEAEEEKLKEETIKAAEAEVARKAAEEAKLAAKAEEVIAHHEEVSKE
jgi:large subunit ribosomal protein L19